MPMLMEFPNTSLPLQIPAQDTFIKTSVVKNHRKLLNREEDQFDIN